MPIMTVSSHKPPSEIYLTPNRIHIPLLSINFYQSLKIGQYKNF